MGGKCIANVALEIAKAIFYGSVNFLGHIGPGSGTTKEFNLFGIGEHACDRDHITMLSSSSSASCFQAATDERMAVIGRLYTCGRSLKARHNQPHVADGSDDTAAAMIPASIGWVPDVMFGVISCTWTLLDPRSCVICDGHSRSKMMFSVFAGFSLFL